MRLQTLVTLMAVTTCTMGFAHPGHDAEEHANSATSSLVVAQESSSGVSGQGDLRFKVRYTSSHLPAEAQAVLVKAHGGFAIDRRSNKGETYFALPGAGIIQISGDLSSTKMVATDSAMKNTNMHNATIWYGDQPYLVFPGQESATVFTTRLDGTLVSSLGTPSKSHQFSAEQATQYFADGKGFVPTDVEYMGGRYYITTGYSALDYVLTATVENKGGVDAKWAALAFGGKGNKPGEFGTGHGITLAPTSGEITIADRPNSELETFTAEGRYLRAVNVPKGAFPCDVDYTEGYTVVGCLHGPDRDKGAPVYILKDDRVVSTIMPKEELGLEKFQHIHNAVMHKVDGRLYLIVQAWNPGDFAILEQVTD